MPIFDQGYQHWSGSLSGHAWRWWTIGRQGVRVGMKNVFLRALVIFSWLPAAGLAFMLSVWGLVENKSPLVAPLRPFLTGLFSPQVIADPLPYRLEVWTLCFHHFLNIELYFAMIVVLLVGPGLISQDIRFNALPLYFSRPLRRIDYFAGKLAVIAWFLALVIIFPSLIAYVLGLLFSLDITIVRDTFPLLLACLAYGVVIVVSAGTLMLALSSLSRNSRYIALFWVGLWFVTMIGGTILTSVDTQQRRYRAYEAHARAHPLQQPGAKPQTPQEQAAQMAAMQERARKSAEDFEAEETRAARTNWRPLVSYTANLARIGQGLLGTDAAWKELSRFDRNRRREEFFLPQYPWYWSAAVLAVLFGLSAWILNYRVRSLDRLR
jgi:ABC-2 type transport system permease protein